MKEILLVACFALLAYCCISIAFVKFGYWAGAVVAVVTIVLICKCSGIVDLIDSAEVRKGVSPNKQKESINGNEEIGSKSV